MTTIAQIRLEAELRRWRRLGYAPRLWWRDDDVRKPTSALERLLRIADGAPLSLAVIPDGADNGLAEYLNGAGNVTLGQHGLDHVNRRKPGQPAAENRADESTTAIGLRIGAGRYRMIHSGLSPAFYTPPWNHIDRGLPQALTVAGFDAMSTWGADRPSLAPLRRLDVHIDLLRWKGTARFRGEARFLDDLRRRLATRRRAKTPAAPIGLLTHHLDHDEAAWSFLDRFLVFARTHFEIGGYLDFVPPATSAIREISAKTSPTSPSTSDEYHVRKVRDSAYAGA